MACGQSRERAKVHPSFVELEEPQQMANQQRAARAERAKLRRDPEQRERRRQSRRVFRDLGERESVQLARQQFPELFSADDHRALPLGAGESVVRYPEDDVALVETTSGERSVVDSTVPLVTEEDGRQAPVNYGLERTEAGWEPANGPVDIEFGEQPADALAFTGDFRAGVPGASGQGTRTANEVFYADVGTDTDAWFGPSVNGARFAFQLRSEDAPEELRLDIDAGPSTDLRVEPGARALAVLRSDEVVGRMTAPLAFDADGVEIDVTLRAEGDEIVFEIPHRGLDLAYPAVLDPGFEDGDSWKYGNNNFAGWGYYEQVMQFPHGYWLGLYIQRNPNYPWRRGQFAEWQYRSPTAASYIHQAEFIHMYHSAEATNTAQGIWSTRHNRHQHQYTQGYSYDYTGARWSACADGPGPGGGYEAWRCDASVDLDLSMGNYAQSSLWVNADGYRSQTPMMHMGGARIWMSDLNNPYLMYWHDAGSGWMHDTPAGPYNGRNQSHVRWGDAGLGMWRLWMDVPGMSRQMSSQISCSGAHSSRCPDSHAHTFSYANILEGVRTVTTTGQDILSREWSASKTLRIDRSSPTNLAVSGPLRERAGGALYDATASVQVTARDGSSAAPRSGVRTAELLVDGAVHDSATESCLNGQCPYALPSRELTLRADAVPDGRRTLQVRVKDLLGHSTLSPSWNVIFDRRGDIYVAEERDGETDAPQDLVATEWAQLGTHNARRIDDAEMSTRGTVGCSLDPTTQCAETRYVVAAEAGGDEQGESFGRYRGTSVDDRRLEEVATILDPSHSELGSPNETGLLWDALRPGQRPPPAHGATYELYEEKEQIEVDDQPAELIRRPYVDAVTRLLLREVTISGGEVTSDLYYDYRAERLERGELPGDHFAVPRPANASSDADIDYATETPPSEPAEEPPLTTDEQVAEAQAFRQDFGLRADDAYVRETVEDPTLQRSVDSYGVPLTPPEESDLTLRDDAEEAMDLIDDYGATHASDSYAGTYIDQAAGGLVYVGFTLNSDQHMTALREVYPYPERLRLFSALITLPELMELHREVTDDIEVLVAEGFDVVSISEDEETNSVVVTVPEPTLLQEVNLRTRYGLQVRLEQEDKVVPHSSRPRMLWRIPPLFGGLHIFSNRGQCSSAFSVRRGRLRWSLTAGHCGGRGTPWSHWRGSTANPVKLGRTVARGYRSGGNGDFALIRIKRRFATPLLLLRPGASERRYRRIRRAAAFEAGRVRSRRHKGTRICRVGYRFTPPQCGRLLRRDTTVRQCESAGGPCRVFRHQQRASYRSRPGDSGSAVFSRSTAFGVHHSSGGYYTPIENVLNRFNARVVGTP